MNVIADKLALDGLDPFQSQPAQPTWKQKQRLVREEAILDAARVLIAEGGYESMTMEELADKVGISKPTLYQHFPSKEAIAVRAIVEFMERTLQHILEIDPGMTVSDRLDEVVRWTISQRFNCEQIMFGGTKAALVTVVREHPAYQQVKNRMLTALSSIFEQAKAEDVIDSALSTRSLVQMLFSLVRDTEYEQLIKNEECTAREIEDTLCSVFLVGVQKAKQ